ncbi:uncharacterized protein LOC132753472 [Ruditapes philippinarum]|uniref:uncharacterized protein LOC132753472 n=1 Tax=Ruditapes philippinarum TaxID=129788 RepID=UPI00295B9E52|nr:uncharacterized protein LOC132753472 [Ruditapes philippinarum]
MLLTWACLTILTAIDVSAYPSLRDELKELREQIQILRDKATDTYTRWGRTSCPTGATTIYVGFAGGSNYKHSGAAANYLCLSKKPTFDVFSQVPFKSFIFTFTRYYTTFLYGAEYQTSDTPFSSLYNHEVPCAVCQVPRTSAIMIPGQDNCPRNFRLEYAGYLMAGLHTHAAASEFVCVDKHPTEDEYSSSGDAQGKLFYFVQAACGSLKCLPYKRKKMIKCAVCSYSP